MNSKYIGYNSPNFGKWADHSLDEFIKLNYGTVGENANHTLYNPNHKLTEKNGMAGVRDFQGYSPRKLNRVKLTESSAEPTKSVKGHHSILKNETSAPFCALIGRDNLYERMHGLPKECKEEIVKR